MCKGRVGLNFLKLNTSVCNLRPRYQQHMNFCSRSVVAARITACEGLLQSKLCRVHCRVFVH